MGSVRQLHKMFINDERLCNTCHEVKHLSEFYKRDSTRVRSQCKSCCAASSSRWRANNRARYNELSRQRRNTRSERLNHVRKKFGLTAEQYESLEQQQGYACAIAACRRPFAELNRQPHVDHCHVTGRVRGLLCHQCNQALGNARDDIAVLQGLINYLEVAK